MPSGIITRIFEGRRSKVKEMLSIASTADRKCQMDVALRYYSWAETLMRSLPSPDVVAIAEAKSRRETILKGLNVEFDRQDIYDKGIVELTFTFDGKPVKNIDYKFFDGKSWSKVLSAKDGEGFVEVRPGSKIDQYRIKYEITPAHLQHLFMEVSLVEKALAPEAEDTDGGTRSAKTHSGPAVTATASESSARKIDFSAVKKKVLDVVAREEFQTEPGSARGGLTPIVFSSEYEDIVHKVCKGVTSGADESIYEYFTPEGYEIFNRLIRYGNARVLNFGELYFYGLGEEVYARSVPMVFSFRGNQRQFAQNIDALFFSPNAELKDEFSDLYQALFKNAGPHIKVITALSTKGIWLTRKGIIAATGLTDNGAFSTVLEELENCGFIRKYSPFGSNVSQNRKRLDSSSLYQLIDFYTLFYFRFIEKNSYQDERFWTTSVNSPLHNIWCGLSFEMLCLCHLKQIKMALGISGVQTLACSWRGKGDESKKDVQIDLLIDRKDETINLCEMKYSKDKFEISLAEEQRLSARLDTFRSETNTRKSVLLTLITTKGIKPNSHSDIVQSEVTLEELFV